MARVISGHILNNDELKNRKMSRIISPEKLGRLKKKISLFEKLRETWVLMQKSSDKSENQYGGLCRALLDTVGYGGTIHPHLIELFNEEYDKHIGREDTLFYLVDGSIVKQNSGASTYGWPPYQHKPRLDWLDETLGKLRQELIEDIQKRINTLEVVKVSYTSGVDPNDPRENLGSGLCVYIERLLNLRKITKSEHDYVKDLLRAEVKKRGFYYAGDSRFPLDHKRSLNHLLVWKPYIRRPRLAWLNKNIKELKEELLTLNNK